MGTIVAIGGGNLNDLGTFIIDKYIVSISAKECPNVLFIPTASDDSQGYIDVFNSIYCDKLGCITDTLLLAQNKVSEKDIKNKILSSDIIYVGGGNTSKMLDTWRKKKVDEYLGQAFRKGTILSGLSAGSMCWFKHGYSDSGVNEDRTSCYICLEGLGFINAINCPHYNEEERKGFDNIISVIEETGIALENNCALVIKDDTFKILKSDEKANAFKLINSYGNVQKFSLANEDFASINKLFDNK